MGLLEDGFKFKQTFGLSVPYSVTLPSKLTNNLQERYPTEGSYWIVCGV